MNMLAMTRRIDPLGRIVIPAEFRRLLGIEAGDRLDMTIDGDRLVIGKTEPECAFCGAREHLLEVHHKHVCQDCADLLVRESTALV
jgi:transcriptional pleiotropic regulator of transition state genes